MKGRFVLLIAVAASLYVASVFKVHSEPKRFCDDFVTGDTVVVVKGSNYCDISVGDTVFISETDPYSVKLEGCQYLEDREHFKLAAPCVEIISFWRVYFLAVSIGLTIAIFGYLFATFAYETTLSKWLDKTFGI